jgi:hypothetical protein
LSALGRGLRSKEARKIKEFQERSPKEKLKRTTLAVDAVQRWLGI